MRLPTRKKELERLQTQEVDLYITPEKLARLKKELERLVTKDRGEAAAEVIRTGEMGDFSENAGYQWAKANLRRINARILTLTDHIQRAILIPKDTSDGLIRIGSLVTMNCQNQKLTYQILGSQETNPSQGKISHQSPLGQALLGHRAGDRVEIAHGGNTIAYDVLIVQ